MESSPQGAGSITSGSKEGKLKAHVDCSNGVNSTTLLAACLDASEENSVSNANSIDKALEGLYKEIFGEPDLDHSLPTSKTIVIPNETKGICLGLHPRSRTITLHHIFDAYMTQETSTSPLMTADLLTIPAWVEHIASLVFGEITDAICDDMRGKPKTTEQDLEEAHHYIFQVYAMLLCLDSMGIREVTCSPLPMIFSSSSMFSDGDAVSILQKGMEINPFKTVHFDDQSTPPTSIVSTAIGIAILKVLTGASSASKDRFRLTPMILEKHGFGIDDNDKNVKVSIAIGRNKECDTENKSTTEIFDLSGQSTSSTMPESTLFHSDHVAHLETNLDDISGESLAFAIELLLSHGAIDAWVTPIVMKKGRPAHTLHCLCKDNGLEEDANALDKLLRLIFEHTSTLGVRIYRSISRKKLDRTMVTVTTPFDNTSRKGKVDIKVSSFKDGYVVRKKAEFDHCKEIAIETGVGVQEVARLAIQKYDEMT